MYNDVTFICHLIVPTRELLMMLMSSTMDEPDRINNMGNMMHNNHAVTEAGRRWQNEY
jgi:hypothetical protein